MKIFKGVERAIGYTPLVALDRMQDVLQLQATLLAKYEAMNPGGSVKDRLAKALLDDAESRGVLAPGGTVIEPTSGNTGVGLAMLAAQRGYRVILTMPETMSIERRRLLAAYGAELVLTEGKLGMKGAIEKAEALLTSIPGSTMPGQFTNPANPEIHRRTTGPEIWDACDGELDCFVAGVGTGGTITGVGEYLKSRRPSIRIVAVEPSASPILSGGKAGPHPLQGIGAGFIPSILNTAVYDEVIQVTGEDAMATARLLAQREGLLTGISSGAALWAAISLARRAEYAGHSIAVLLPDTGERYLSTPLYAEDVHA